MTGGDAATLTRVNLASSTAYTNAKAVADSIANGTYSGGTLITGTSVISPIIAGAGGYFSNLFQVGASPNTITLDGTNKKMYVGTGSYGNSNTAFYVDGSSNFSLGDKLTWNNSTLNVTGNGSFTGTITASAGTIGGWTINTNDLTSNSGSLVLNKTGTLVSTSGSNVATFGTGKITITNASTATFSVDGSSNQMELSMSGVSRPAILRAGNAICVLYLATIGIESDGGSLYIRNSSGDYKNINALSFTTSSSRRWKENIKPIENALTTVQKLNGVTFNWKDKNIKNDIGFIAEEVNDLLPTIVGKGENGSIEGLEYGKVTALLVEAIKELNQKIDKLSK